MPRKYDCIVRFYASWFTDLSDENKGFSFEEIGKILMKIAEAQIKGDAEIVQELPITIKRGLQMATLEEQIERLIERAARCKERGSVGGQHTAQRNAQHAQESQSYKDKYFETERKLQQSEKKRTEIRKEYARRLYDRLYEISGKSGYEIAKTGCDIKFYRQVYGEDLMKGKLAFPDWLIYYEMFSVDQVKNMYKELLKTDKE